MHRHRRLLDRLGARVASAALALAAGWPLAAAAHDEHNNLPSTGVAVDGDRVRISPEAAQALRLTTALVRLADLDHQVTANSTVEVPWRQHAFATTLVAGRIERVLVQPGERVTAGQELVRVESLDMEALQLDLLKATADLALANRMVEQRTGLARSGSIAERRLLESQAERNDRLAQRGIAIRKLLSLGLRQETLDQVLATGQPVRTVSITSPIDGVISDADVRVGQVVDPWQHLYEIVDLGSVWVHGQVLETDSANLVEGLPVQVTFEALGGQAFQGQVDHVGIKIDSDQRSVHVHVALDNAQGLLRPGMFGRMRIRVAEAREAVACPIDALILRGDQAAVLVEERAGTYVDQPVVLGMRTRGWVEIRDGLFPGDPVVMLGKAELASLFAPRAGAAESVPPAAALRARSAAGATGTSLDAAARPIVAQATVELPTDKKALAYSSVEGRIAKVLVEHGDRVTRGQVLAEIESLELRNRQLDLLQARSKLNLAQQSLARFKRLDQEGAIAEKDLWQMETDASNLRATVDSLSHKLSLMGLSAEDIERIESIDITSATLSDDITTTFQVRAPIEGRITAFDLSVGQVVRSQDQLFEIHDLRQVLVRGYVHEQDTARVRIGQPVTVTITADATYSASSKIARTAPLMSTAGRALSIWAELDNRDLRLKEGMLARLALDEHAPAASPDHAAPPEVDSAPARPDDGQRRATPAPRER